MIRGLTIRDLMIRLQAIHDPWAAEEVGQNRSSALGGRITAGAVHIVGLRYSVQRFRTLDNYIPQTHTKRGRRKSATLILVAQALKQIGMSHLVSVETSLLAMSRMKSATLILYGSL